MEGWWDFQIIFRRGGEEGIVFTSDSNNSCTSDKDNIFQKGLPLFQNSLSVSEFNAILLVIRQRHNILNKAMDSILKTVLAQKQLVAKVKLPFGKEKRKGAELYLYKIFHMHELPIAFNKSLSMWKWNVQLSLRIC